MTETKWTPGPWAVVDVRDNKSFMNVDWIVTETRDTDRFGPRCIAALSGDGQELDECKANANLIAAAPDMYAALKRADAYIDGLNRATDKPLSFAFALRDECRAALAKARGKTE